MPVQNPMKPRLLFIGAVNEGGMPMGGEEFKNSLLLPMVRQYFQVNLIDTARWRRNPRVLLTIFWNSFFAPLPDRILVSASSVSTYRLFYFWQLRKRLLSRSVYLVIGGYFPKAITNGRFRASVYQFLDAIVVEGNSLKSELNSNGLSTNVRVLPNFKPMLPYFGQPDRFHKFPPLRCVVISRICKEKGIVDIFKALELCPEASIRIDLFGPVDPTFRVEFQACLDLDSRVQYKGYLDLMNNKVASYRRLASYHVLLFPTHWVGEGFPGVVLDAYLAGLPVIATDWNMNQEVVISGKTGWLIPSNNPEALADAIQQALSSPSDLAELSINSRKAASAYDATKVFHEELLPMLLP
jgi:glycosyltransferase involved in cell wall biosynthesis